MRGRRRDDGWDEGGQDKQDGRPDPWSGSPPDDWANRDRTDAGPLDSSGPAGAGHGGPGASAPDWPASGDWPGVTAYQRAAEGQPGFGGSGAYGAGQASGAGQGYGAGQDHGAGQGYGAGQGHGAGQGYGGAAYGSAAYGSGPAPSFGGPGAGYGGGDYRQPGYTQSGYPGGGYAAADGTGSADGYGPSSGWGTPGGYGASNGSGASGDYGTSWFGEQGGGPADAAGTGFGTSGYPGPDQSRGGYADAGYGQAGYGMQEPAATAQYGRLPAAQLPPGQGPDLASEQYTRSDWTAAANDISPATPRPYGRLSIFTLLEDRVAEFDRLAEQAAEGVRTSEPDTLVYVIHVVPKAPMQRIIYEIYRDRAAFESHERQPHIQRFGEARKACVLATNIIDLRLKYAKVAALAAPPPPHSLVEDEPPRAQRALETSARMPSFSPHGGGQPVAQGTGEFADPGAGWPAEAGGRHAGRYEGS